MTSTTLPSASILQAIAEVSGVRAVEDVTAVAAGVRELSRRFTKGRGEAAATYLDRPDFLAAYLQYYLPVNLAKVRLVLDELPERDRKESSRGPFRVLDVGAGPGTGSLAVLEWWCGRSDQTTDLLVLAIDRSHKALSLAEDLWGAAMQGHRAERASLHSGTVDLERQAEVQRFASRQSASFDLVIVANSVNEWFRMDRDPVGRRAKILTILLSMLDPSGSLVIVEPALREHTRALHALRDRLLQQRICTVYSPCVHDAPCPALGNSENWCHEERTWQAPPIVVEIDREVGFIKDALKFSYLVLRKDGRTIVPRAPELVRVVSEQRAFKGELRVWACGEAGRWEIGRLDRERSETNAAFDQTSRGTIVRIEGSLRKEASGLGRLPAGGTVEIVRPA